MHILSKQFFLLLICFYTCANYTTTIQPETQWSIWDGWGVSLCWWANLFGFIDEMADLIFTMKDSTMNGVKMPGLGLNAVRFNAFQLIEEKSKRYIVGETVEVRDLEDDHWMRGTVTKTGSNPKVRIDGDPLAFEWDHIRHIDSSGNWDWSADENQTAMLKKAHQRGVNIVELFFKLPFKWTLKNRDLSEIDYYYQHAVNMVQIIKYFQKSWGITFHSIEAFNEPVLDALKRTEKPGHEDCHFDNSTQSMVLSMLRAELDAKDMSFIQLAMADEGIYNMDSNTWESFFSSTNELVDQVNVHGYDLMHNLANGGGRRKVLHNDAIGKELWNSEYGDPDATGILLTKNLNLDLRWLHPTAWIYWQILDGGGWGLIEIHPEMRRVWKVNMKYFVFAHYSRHIRPGMTIIDGGEANTVAAYDKITNKLVIITTNYRHQQRITYDLSHFTSVEGPVTRWSTNMIPVLRGDQYTKYNDIDIRGFQFSSNFDPNTIQTFEIENAIY